jgi:hypothetical protein
MTKVHLGLLTHSNPCYRGMEVKSIPDFLFKTLKLEL